MAIRERLDSLSRGELAGLASSWSRRWREPGLWYTRSLPNPVQIAASAGCRLAGGVAQSSGADRLARASAAPIIVDVTGWVREPGVYEFAPGDRVIDAVERAGGATEGRRPHHR